MQYDYETASNEDGAPEVTESTDVPTIPDSMVPETTEAVDLSGGEEPPVPNHPRIQPETSTTPPFDLDLTATGDSGGGGELIRAEVGVGKRGQSLNDERGIGAMIVQPARSLFATEQRVVFNIQIPKAVQLFEATEGRKPRSHDEYMSKIIKANLIKLPALPAGQKYIYDPIKGELMVQKSGR